MQLLNIFSDRLNNLINSSNNKDVISYGQKKNVTSPQLLAKRRNRVSGQVEIEKKVAERNRIADYFKIKLEMKSTNNDLSDVRFFIKE